MSTGERSEKSTGHASRPRDRSNIGIGIITLGAIGAAAASGIFLPGYLRSPLLRYQISVPAGEDISGVARGTSVLVGGLPRGRVVSVEDVSTQGSARFIVQFEIEPDPPMTSNVRARFVRDVVSNKSVINFTPIDAPDGAPVPLAEGSDVKVNNEVSDAALFMTPAAQRAFNRTWINVERASKEWPPLFASGKAKTASITEDLRRFRAEFEATFPGNADRIEALMERFRAVGDRLEEVRDEWQGLSKEFGLVRDSLAETGSAGRIRRLFAGLGERFTVAGIEGESFGTIMEGVGRRWEDLKASGETLRARFRELSAEVSLKSSVTDWTIAATELAELSNHLLRTAVDILFPNRTSEDEARLADDHLSRQLLFGIQQARHAESSLRTLLESSEGLPATMGDLDRLVESLQRLADIEQALWQRRIEPFGPPDASGQRVRPRPQER